MSGTEGDGVQQTKHDEQQHPISPSHEFSFTVSHLHPPKNTSTPPPFAAAVDLSPAGEIFFHGHLLPLRLLSHLPASPRRSSSANSMDSFTLPLFEELLSSPGRQTAPTGGRSLLEGGKEGRGKSKSFSLLFRLPKRRGETTEGQKGKSKFDHYVSRFVAKCARLMRKGRENCTEIENRRRNDCGSFSGNLKSRRSRLVKKGLTGRKEFSAPASTKNSPANSGLLVSTGNNGNYTSRDHSTMEELQAAIESAIAHCKNSIDDAGEDKNKKLP